MQIQIQHRGHPGELPGNPDLHEFIERKIHFSLNRFNGKVRSVSVRLADANGPKGGIDQECRITVRLSWGAQVQTSVCAASIHAVVTLAAERVGRSVGRMNDLRQRGASSVSAAMPFAD